jgi:hypothetical protein
MDVGHLPPRVAIRGKRDLARTIPTVGLHSTIWAASLMRRGQYGVAENLISTCARRFSRPKRTRRDTRVAFVLNICPCVSAQGKDQGSGGSYHRSLGDPRGEKLGPVHIELPQRSGGGKSGKHVSDAATTLVGPGYFKRALDDLRARLGADHRHRPKPRQALDVRMPSRVVSLWKAEAG